MPACTIGLESPAKRGGARGILRSGILGAATVESRAERASGELLDPQRKPAYRPQASVLAVALLALPLMGFAAAVLVTGTVHARYMLASVAGAAVLAADLAYRFDRPQPRIGAALFLSLALLFAGSQFRHASQAYRNPWAHQPVFDDYPSGDIVVASPFDFAWITYQPRAPLDRLVYLADFDLAVRQIETDTSERLLTELSRWVPLRVEPFRTYTAKHMQFLLLASGNNGIWILQELRDRGAVFQVVAKKGDYELYRVTLPHPSGQ